MPCHADSVEQQNSYAAQLTYGRVTRLFPETQLPRVKWPQLTDEQRLFARLVAKAKEVPAGVLEEMKDADWPVANGLRREN